MFRNILLKILQDELYTFRSRINQMVADSAASVLKLDPKSQYLIVLESDDSARELATRLNETFDLENGPRIVVLSAKNVKLIEINKE